MSVDATEQLIDLVYNQLDRDPKRLVLWFSTPNKDLGGLSPAHMLDQGLEHSLLRYVQWSTAPCTAVYCAMYSDDKATTHDHIL